MSSVSFLQRLLDDLGSCGFVCIFQACEEQKSDFVATQSPELILRHLSWTAVHACFSPVMTSLEPQTLDARNGMPGVSTCRGMCHPILSVRAIVVVCHVIVVRW